MPSSAPVSVARLCLKGDASHKDALLAGLDDMHWPAADARGYLIVRQVRVRAPWWQAIELVGQDTRALAAGAVSGWSAQARDAAAVRFADLADLIACLSHDLARGQAGGLWFWQTWARVGQQSGSIAIAQLWHEHAILLPDLVARLDAQGSLATVCAQLDDAAITRILEGAQRATGWPLHASLVRSARAATADATPQPLPDLRDWQAVRASLPAQRLVALAPLIALTSGWLQIPQQMQDATQWRAWQERVYHRLSGDRASATAPDATAAPVAVEQPAAPGKGRPVDSPLAIRNDDQAAPAPRPARSAEASQGATRRGADGDAPDHPAADRAASPAPHPAGTRRGDRDRAGSAPDRGDLATNRSPAAMPQAARAATSPGDLHAEASSMHPSPARTAPAQRHVDHLSPPSQAADHAPIASAQEASRDEHTFHTRQGGLFYLLNVLAHPAIAPALAAWREPGWHRLYRLGLHLGLVCDAPLARFLAHKLELADAGCLAELPPLEGEPVLLQLADRHFAHVPAWGPQLLEVPAQAVYTRSHLDLYYPLAAVRLEVRRAGLDVDPGWLPWLGQVVRFHYRDDHAGGAS